MPVPNTTGGPDFGAQLTTNPAAPAFDAAEQTSRLLMGGGAANRTGKIIWATGFEGALTFTDIIPQFGQNQIAQGGAPIPNGSKVYAWQGNNYLLLYSGTLVGQDYSVVKNFPSNFLTGRIGVECMMALVGPADFHFDFNLQNGGVTSLGLQGYTSALRILSTSVPTKTFLQVRDGAGVYQTIADVTDIMGFGQIYHNVKFVVDFKAGRYVRVVLNTSIYDVSSIATQAIGIGGNVGYLMLDIIPDTAANKVIAIDNLILTSDEP